MWHIFTGKVMDSGRSLGNHFLWYIHLNISWDIVLPTKETGGTADFTNFKLQIVERPEDAMDKGE
mgnify:CR=1 FL=1